MNIYTKESIKTYINSLKNYQGYIQFSDTPIRECDIFREFQDIKLSLTKGFIYEAHFFNGEDSIAIKQVNNTWIVDDVKKVDTTNKKIYHAIENLEVEMAQIWEAEEDEFCENMKVKKLKKVVFAGFKSKNKQKNEKTLLSDLTQEHKDKLLDKFLSIYNDKYITTVIDEIRSER